MKQIKPYLIFLAVLVGILAGIALTAEFDLTPQLSAENNNAELREMRDSATIEQKDRDIARSVSDTLAWASAGVPDPAAGRFAHG
ncbi:MAG: hypothetical protein U5N86_13125 [Planctomycetota bacterium]|nr:hypothetical protein [Planctomycetota bacterium]